jgi:hypothetical protein
VEVAVWTLGNPGYATLVEGTRGAKETIEPGEAMPNVGASDGTEVYRAILAKASLARSIARELGSSVTMNDSRLRMESVHSKDRDRSDVSKWLAGVRHCDFSSSHNPCGKRAP